MRYAMIMAGGAGTRLWPMSRKGQPKQLLRFIKREGDKKPRALLELADARLDKLIDQDCRYICTAEQYRTSVRDLLPSYDDDHVLGEPAARDTVNAVGAFVEAAIDDMRVYRSTCVGGPACDAIDFNGDGLYPDTADIDDFLTAFSGGPC